MGRLQDEYSQIIDFIIRQKLQHLLDYVNKLDLTQDKINQLNSLVMEAQASYPNEAGEIQLESDSETGLTAYLNSAVWTFLFKEHWYKLYGHMQPEIYPHSGLNFPVSRLINNSHKMAAAFPHGADAGWDASWQVAKKLGAYNLGLVLEYHAANPLADPKGVVFICTGRVVAVGETVSSGGISFSESLTVTIPNGSNEETLRVAYFPLVASADLEDDDLVIVEDFRRDVSDVGDTLAVEILISGWKPYWTDREPEGSPLE